MAYSRGMDTTLWQVPRLTNRLQRISEAAVLVVGIVVFVLVVIAWPRYWWVSAPIVLVLAYLLVVLLTERTWVGPEAVSRRRWGPWRATLGLADVKQVQIQVREPTGASLVLQGSPTIAVPLVQITMFDSHSQSPEVARKLADAVADLPGGKDVAMKLRAHATHTADGGTPEGSPLLRR